MSRQGCTILLVAFLGVWILGFSSLAAVLWYRDFYAPVATANIEAFKFRFGLLANDGNNTYSIKEETTTIPMVYGDSTYGFQVIPPDNESYSVQFIVHFPYPPKTISGDVFESNTPAADMRSVKTDMQGTYVQDMGFDPGDPVGDHSIEIWINGKLAKTIKFTVTAPTSNQK